MNKILTGILWALASCGVLVLLGFVQYDQNNLPCRGPQISIDQSGDYFILEEDVKTMLRQMGYQLNEGDQVTQLCQFDVAGIERRLNNNPFVADADVYITIDGYLKMDIKQRKPLLRIFSGTRESFYLDTEGHVMPLSGKYTARVMVANGDLPFGELEAQSLDIQNIPMDGSADHLKVLGELYKVALKLSTDKFWKSQINQIYVADNGDIELTPRVGNHRIIIGNADNLDTKMKKLMILYEKGFTKTGWNEYSVINLKFENQVVCTKK